MLDDETQDAAEIMGRPVVVFDEDLNVIAYSVHEKRADRQRLSALRGRGDEPGAGSSPEISAVRQLDGPAGLALDVDGSTREMIPLRYKGWVCGYLSFVVHGAEEASDYQGRLAPTVERLGTLIALRASERLREREHDVVNGLLADLLDSSSEVRARSAETLMSRELISSADQYSVILLGSHERSDGDFTPGARLAVEEALTFIAKSTTLRAVGGAFGGEGIVVIPRSVNRQRLLRLVDHHAFNGVVAGGGSIRSALSDVVESYREAHIALKAVSRLPDLYGRVALWSDLGLDRILLQLPLHSIRLEDLPTSVLLLIEKQAGFNLAATLDCYLRCAGDVQATARMLHIHRSSLYYRLDRISDLIGLDLTDGNVRREIHTGLHVARIAGFWSRE